MEASDHVIADNLERVRKRVARAVERSNRRAEEITIVAVSKTFSVESIRAAHSAGLRQFGENRVQEWESKELELRDLAATWHLVGHLQSNKARRAAHLFTRVDSVDSVALAQKLESAAAGKFTLVPSEAMLSGLRRDFDAMTGMIFGPVPTLDAVMASIALIESRLRTKAS